MSVFLWQNAQGLCGCTVGILGKPFLRPHLYTAQVAEQQKGVERTPVGRSVGIHWEETQLLCK